MATKAQIHANRLNAAKSTGPRTPAGKARVSRNSFRHGLRAEKHILDDDEDPALYLALLQSLHDLFQPESETEVKLVERIASAQFRLGRAPGLEMDLHREYRHEFARREQIHHHAACDIAEMKEEEPPPPPPPSTPASLRARAFLDDSTNANIFTKLSRYETTLERSIERAIKLLERLQALRDLQIAEQTQPEITQTRSETYSRSSLSSPSKAKP